MTKSKTTFWPLNAKIKDKKFSSNSNGISFKALLVIFLFFAFTNLQAQEKITVSGTITESDSGVPLPGVSIVIKGTTKGTSTNFDGKYTISNVPSNTVLVVSYLGYATKEVKVAGKSSIDISLAPSTESLDEIVVVGYGTSKKSDLTGSVVAISGSDIAKQPISNVGEALTGRLPGVQIVSSEGSPDSEINIRIRGGGSITQNSSPLVIVDGFPVNSMSDIASSDIENISILKDASSTAIYGSRGANGVIIVTTKSGKDGKITANFNMFYGVSSIANSIDVLDVPDYVKWQYEYALLRNSGGSVDNPAQSYERYFGLWQDYDQYLGQKGTNWQKQVYGKMGKIESRDLSVRGGSEKFNFNINYALYDQKAIMLGSNFRRDNLSVSLKSKASDRIDLTFTLRYANTEVNGGGANEQNEASSADARLRHSIGYSPIPLPGLTTDDTDEALQSYLVDPFLAVDDNQRRKTRKNFNMVGSFSWRMIDNLKYRMDVGLDNRVDTDNRFYGRSTYYANNRPSADNQGLPALVTNDRTQVRFRNANTLNYNFEDIIKSKDHEVKLLIGEEMIISRNSRLTNEIHGFPKFFGFDTATNLSSQGTPQAVNNFFSPDDKLLSFFGRFNYAYKNKYLLTATYRADGSSKFLGDNAWGYFPSAAIAWKVKEEDYLQDVDWLTSLKLRLSYGESGNNNIPTGQTVQNFQSNNTTYINGVNNYWAASNVLANPDLKWETTVTQNIGLDFGLFDNRITGSIEAYKNLTQDLLIRYGIPGSGYTYQYRNMGEVQNTGIEGSLNFSIIDKENYGLNLSVNASANKNKINSLGIQENFGEATNWASSQIGIDYLVNVGQPLGIMQGFRNDGRYEVSDFNYDPNNGGYTLKDGVADNLVIGDVRPGSLKLKDISGPNGVPDGVVDINDQTVIGDSNPDLTGGFVLTGRAYGFDLSAAFNFSLGQDIYNANKIEFTTSNQNGQYRNLSTIMADGNRWTNLDPNTGQLVTDPTQLQALNKNTTMWSPFMSRFVFSDWAVEDASFLRLNTLTLGYSLQADVVEKIGLSNLRFYVTANNVFLITNYSGPDPEVSTRRRTPLTPGVDYSAYPRSRQFVFGLNLNF